VRRLVPLGLFVFLIATALGDHYFRDEFYYLACSRRLAWGYVDHPPLSIALLWLLRHTAGDSLLALRVAAALVAALNVALTGSLARRLGASAFGEALAMIATAIAPLILSLGSFYSMNVFDLIVWTLAARILVDLLDRPTLMRWALLGVVLGLGLENKMSVLWLGAGIVGGLLATPSRRLLLTPGPWLAGTIAAVLFAPHVAWQIVHGWPTLEFIRNASRDKMQANTPLQFVADQALKMNPLTLPVWLAGLVWLLFARGAARFRPLAVSFLTVAAILMLNGTSRSGYLAAAYPALFAAGGVAIERGVQRRAWRAVMLAVLLAGGAALAPLAVPVLSTARYEAYSRALGIAPDTEEKKALARLPQFFADRQGWDRFVDQVAAAFDRLSPAERASATALVGNYGEAGAIEQLGRARGLTAISGHNNYWFWGPAGHTGDVLVVVSRSREQQDKRFVSVEQVGVVDCGDCMPYENGQFIFVCRGMKPPPLAERWTAFKHYN
jgi:Dolichyl-phosphate-mannose-protein mannosyltransferase